MNLNPVGTHCILELYDVDPPLLDDEPFIRSAMEQAAGKSLSTVLKVTSHKFEPQGVTALALLAESHISIHTWPENRYAAVDIFTCGETAKPEQACAFMVRQFKAGRHQLNVLRRGVGMDPERGVVPIEEKSPPAKESVLCPVHN